ncbi:hypothetical protein [Corynebacterium pyruviciproducens]|uniref:hypothetical protein n=1 Tax=Corynebacterium pyruviciproducens TaxID=598660 RepID=UPI0023EF846E|nr:hypothetical protein [Corynebacterium pyruviciproducens]
MSVKLVADGGEITVGARVAVYTYGAFNVVLPQGKELATDEYTDDGYKDGYVYRPKGAEKLGRFDIAFTRADITIDTNAGYSNFEAVVNAAQRKVSEDVYFERDITGAGLGGWTPGKDYRVGDMVDVLVFNRVIPQPVTAITYTSAAEDPLGVRVHVGGQTIRDTELVEEQNRTIKEAIAKESATRRAQNKNTRDMAVAARRDGVAARADAAAAKDAAGRAVTEQVFEFAAGVSRTEVPASGWSQAYPGGESGVVWQRSVTYFGDGRVERGPAVVTTGAPGKPGPQGATGPQGPQGPKGDPGEDAGRILDTRDDNQPPSYYVKNYPQKTVKEFKYCSVVGLPAGPMFVVVETTVQWSDFTGGSIQQIATFNDKTYKRFSVSSNEWSRWEEKGAQGPQGPRGPQGESVHQMIKLWRWAASKPATPTGTNISGWATTQPAYQVGTTLWTTTCTIFSTGRRDYTPVTEEASVSAATAIAAESASTKNRVWYAATDPAALGERPGDTWFRYSGNTIVGQWRWTGSSWVTQTIGDEVIANLDAGKITAGILDARHIGAGSIDASKLKADSITVRELRAGTIVPIGTSLIVSEPPTSGATPEPIWWQQPGLGTVVEGATGKYAAPLGNRYKNSTGGTTAPPMRLVKVQPGKKYRLRFWTWALDAGSRLYVEMRDKDGGHAVKSGAVSGYVTPKKETGNWGGWAGPRWDYTGSARGAYLVENLEVPTAPTLIESIIEFNPEVEWVKLAKFYWNHPNGVKTVQYLAGLTLDLDVVDQAQIDALQNKQIEDNKARVTEVQRAQQKADRAIQNEVDHRMHFGSTYNTSANNFFCPEDNPYVGILLQSPSRNATRVRIFRKCRGSVFLIQQTKSGLMDINTWSGVFEPFGDLTLYGGSNQIVVGAIIMYQLWDV